VPGESVLFFTDGLTARSSVCGEQFGMDGCACFAARTGLARPRTITGKGIRRREQLLRRRPRAGRYGGGSFPLCALNEFLRNTAFRKTARPCNSKLRKAVEPMLLRRQSSKYLALGVLHPSAVDWMFRSPV